MLYEVITNISRFILTAVHETGYDKDTTLSTEDKKIIDDVKNLASEITKDMESFKYYIAGEKLYHYTWHTFADSVLEMSKATLQGDDMEVKKARVHRNNFV